MSDSKNSSGAAPKPEPGKPEDDKNVHEVDEQAQKEAAEERAKSGGYD